MTHRHMSRGLLAIELVTISTTDVSIEQLAIVSARLLLIERAVGRAIGWPQVARVQLEVNGLLRSALLAALVPTYDVDWLAR